MEPVRVNKGRVTTLYVSLDYDVSDVSADTFSSQIRAEPKVESDLIATWSVAFLADGSDGELVLTLDDSENVIVKSNGYMDMKRIVDDKPVSVWEKPLEVVFVEPVTE